MAARPYFPLLQLPSTVVMKVLKSMDAVDQIAISLVSKATKSLIISVNVQVAYTDIVIGNTFMLSIRIRTSSMDWHFRNEDTVKLVKTDGSREDPIRTTYEWRKEGFGVKNWIDHLTRVTNNSIINKIVFIVIGEQSDINFVTEMVKGLEINKVIFNPGCSNEFCQLVLAAVRTRRLEMYRNPYQDKESFQKNLMENFETIRFSTEPELTLNDLLVMNSPTLHTHAPENITLKTLNRFIKCWRTGCNKQLKCMTILNRRFPSIDDILQGIKYTKYPENKTREFEEKKEFPSCERVMTRFEGGYDICAFDGRKATVLIQVKSSFIRSRITFLVWPF